MDFKTTRKGKSSPNSSKTSWAHTHTHPLVSLKIKKSDQQMVRKMWRNWNCHTLLTRKQNGAATLGSHLAFPEMNKLKVTTWPNHSTFGIYPREMRTDTHTEPYIQIFVVIVSTPTKRWNNQNIHQQTNKQNVVYPYNGILCCHEKGWNSDTCYNTGESFIFFNMDESWNIMLSEISQSWVTTYSIPFIWKSRKR